MRQLKITKSITNRESASLDKYLQEIGREDLITVEEEVELAQRTTLSYAFPPRSCLHCHFLILQCSAEGLRPSD